MNLHCAGCRKAVCDGCLLQGDQLQNAANLATNKNQTEQMLLPEGYKSDKLTDKEQKAPYGIAVDLGTTTIAALLWNRASGSLLLAKAASNPQTIYGSDVIARISYALAGRVKQLQQAVTDCMEQLTEELCKEAGIHPGQIGKLTVCGNPTMCHLLLGKSVSGLAQAPFSMAYTGSVQLGWRELADTAWDRVVQVLPAIAHHVGADLTADLLYLMSQKEKEGSWLLMDIGTNGELALCVEDTLYVCSTAAGPAFEGAMIQCGMRAQTGAITGVRLEDGIVSLQTVGNAEPAGLCGSGLIDTIAELLRLGLIDETGYLMDKAEAVKKQIAPAYWQRLTSCEEQNAFQLTQTVFLTSQDVRQVQLAKGAIQAGCQTLLQKAEITGQTLDTVYLAGAFGNYLHGDSAKMIGLLPTGSQTKLLNLGNAAGMGASMVLLCADDLKKAEQIADRAVHVELAEDAEFQKLYVECMNF